MLSIQWLAGSNSLADNQKMHDAIIGVCNIVNWTMPTFLAMTDFLAHRETRVCHYTKEDQSFVVAANIAGQLAKRKSMSWFRGRERRIRQNTKHSMILARPAYRGGKCKRWRRQVGTGK